MSRSGSDHVRDFLFPLERNFCWITSQVTEVWRCCGKDRGIQKYKPRFWLCLPSVYVAWGTLHNSELGD